MPKWKITYQGTITNAPVTEVTADKLYDSYKDYSDFLVFENETTVPPVDGVPQDPIRTIVLKLRKDAVLAVLNEDIQQ